MHRSKTIREKLVLKWNQAFRSSSHMLPLMLDQYLLDIFLEVKNELFLIKTRESKVVSHTQRHFSILGPEIVIDAEAAMKWGIRCSATGVYLQD